jgi:ArsR family transcriptional regulator
MARDKRPAGPVCCTSVDNLEQVFKALADGTRLRILALLADGEVCVCDIQAALGVPQPKTSRHLAYLRRMGLVVDRKEGLWVYYRLADPDDPVVRTLLSAVLHGLGHVRGVGATTAVPKFACCQSPRRGGG